MLLGKIKRSDCLATGHTWWRWPTPRHWKRLSASIDYFPRACVVDREWEWGSFWSHGHMCVPVLWVNGPAKLVSPFVPSRDTMLQWSEAQTHILWVLSHSDHESRAHLALGTHPSLLTAQMKKLKSREEKSPA